MVYQILLSPKMKTSVIVGNKLLYTSWLTSSQIFWDLGSNKFRKYHKVLKTSKNYGLVLILPPKLKILLVLIKISRKKILKFYCNVLFHMKTKVCLKYLLNDCKNGQVSSNNIIKNHKNY